MGKHEPKIMLAKRNVMAKVTKESNLGENICRELELTENEAGCLVNSILDIGDRIEKETGSRKSREAGMIGHTLLIASEIVRLKIKEYS